MSFSKRTPWARRGWTAGRLATLATAILLVTCTDGDGPVGPREKDWKSLVDEQRAFGDMEAFTALGGHSHAPGAKSRIEQARSMIKERLEAAGLDTKSKSKRWLQKIPKAKAGGGRSTYMENIVGVLPGKRPEAIAIACHYDTKILPDFVGANDGASGIALTLELARQLAKKHAQQPPAFTYYFVFFDGEEAIVDWSHVHEGTVDNCYGSRRMAQNKEMWPIETLILLDMVGDADLKLTYEERSHPELRQIFFEQGKEYFGIDLFGDMRTILDDHIPFVDSGMTRVIDLIDFEYGPGNRYWHTADDTIDRCSPRSLAKVGTLVMRALPHVESWLQAKI